MGIYERLGLTPIINATGDTTRIGGTLLLPEVREAMAEASGAFIPIRELEQAVGRIIADITGAEAGYVTCSASAGLALGTAASIARDNRMLMNRLPDASGFPHEIVIQAGHRNAYDRCFRATGGRLVQVGRSNSCTREELERGLTPNTVAVAWVAMEEHRGLSLTEVAEVAHHAGVHVIVDAAASLPPASNLRRFIEQGADLVAFSGGKALRGPQASGILAGRAELIRSIAAQHQDSDSDRSELQGSAAAQEEWEFGIFSNGIGRPMKVGKEEVVGAVVALQEYLKRDHEAELRQWQADVRFVAEALQGVPGVEAEYVPLLPNRRPVPCVHVIVDPAVVGCDATEIYQRLQHARPRIFLATWLLDEGILVVYPTNLQSGQAELVASGLKDALRRQSAEAVHSGH